jgi:hypothetical protein
MANSFEFITKKVNYYIPIFKFYASVFSSFSGMDYLPDSLYTQTQTKFIKYVRQILKLARHKEILEGIFDNLTDGEKIECLSEIGDSDLNIFTDWFVLLLNLCKKSPDHYVAKRAENLYNFYKKSFDNVKYDFMEVK